MKNTFNSLKLAKWITTLWHLVYVKFISSLFLFLLFANIIEGSDTKKNVFFVRPGGRHYGLQNGSSYENAWAGFDNIQWGDKGVKPGSTLYIVGHHDFTSGYPFLIKSQGAPGNPIMLRGDFSGEKGILDGGQEIKNWKGPDRNGVYYVFSKTFHHGLFEGGKHLKKASDSSCRDGNYFSNNLLRIHFYKPTMGVPSDHKTILSGNDAILLKNKAHISIKGIKFQYNQVGVKTLGDTKDIIVENCSFEFLNGSGVDIKEGARGNIVVKDNRFFFMHNGIYFHDGPNGAGTGSDCIIKGNFISYCNYYSSWNGDGHAVGVQKTSGVIVEKNIISFCKRPVEFWSNDKNEPCANNIFRFNIIGESIGAAEYDDRYDNGSAFIMISNQGATYYNNLFYRNLIYRCAKGFFMTQPAELGLNKIYNNTIAGCGVGIYLTKGADHFKVLNNIFYQNQQHIHWYDQNIKTGTDNVFDYNLYYPVQDDQFNYRSISKLTFKSWRSKSNQDRNSVFGQDPLFEDPLNNDFKLKKNSPAIGRGVIIESEHTLGIDTDKDIGAFRYLIQ